MPADPISLTQAATDVEIIPVTTRSDREAFIRVPFSLYGDDPLWVPPLLLERREHIDKNKNPYFEHAEVAMWLARRNGRNVGRISAQICRLHQERYNDSSGQFGFIEAIDDPAVFAALFATAEGWLRDRGRTICRGPFNFSINDEIGLLVDGFDTPPSFMMAHTHPYYIDRVEERGYTKAKDVIAYDYRTTERLPNNMERVFNRVKKSGELVVRPLNRANLDEDLDLILDIFNDAWNDNWGFVPWTSAEISELGKNLKLLVKDEFIVIAHFKGEAAAMAVTLPNVNDWITDLNGRLLPFGWAKLLWRLMSGPPKSVRLPLMGVRKKYQSSSVGAALALGVIDGIRTYHEGRGTYQAELSWILEDNIAMRRMIEIVGAVPYKTYRVYEKEL